MAQASRPLDLRDRAIVSLLETTAARNSAVRLLRVEAQATFDAKGRPSSGRPSHIPGRRGPHRAV